MLKKNYTKLVILTLSVGIVIRLFLVLLSPPNNSYDDHLEVVQMYSESMEVPLSSDCWECYQPPAYYFISAAILRVSSSLGFSLWVKWKIVQSVNFFLSIILLFAYLKIMKLLNVTRGSRLVALSFLAVLPRDIFTSVMIGNDYLLSFWCVLAALFFIKTYKYAKFLNSMNFKKAYILLCLLALLAYFTKQHGLLVALLPISIGLYCFLRKWNFKFTLFVLMLCLTIISVNSYFIYSETGKFIISNQHFFDYAISQQPGSIDKVEFFTFRFFSLISDPFISNTTLCSLPTELFARTYFDYEWRFLSPAVFGSYFIGRIAYLWGFFWSVLFVYWLFKHIRILKIQKLGFVFLSLFAVMGFFFLVPVIQTVRFPYFSSMKAMFILPALLMLSVCLSKFIPFLKFNTIVAMVVGNLIFGISMVGFIAYNLSSSILSLHGPLWLYP